MSSLRFNIYCPGPSQLFNHRRPPAHPFVRPPKKVLTDVTLLHTPFKTQLPPEIGFPFLIPGIYLKVIALASVLFHAETGRATQWNI